MNTRRLSAGHAPVVRWAAIAGLCVLGCVMYLGIQHRPPKPTTLTETGLRQAASAHTIADLAADLLRTGADADIAALNLAAAVDLPGSESLERDHCLAVLDEWAGHVRSETARHLYRFQADPGAFDSSEAYFRMLMLTVVLQEDFGVHYNPDRIDEPDFTDSRDLFIHGMIPAKGRPSGRARTEATAEDLEQVGGGTCVSMPVLYAAIGRRLGYPLKLAVSKGHVFARWDGEDNPDPRLRGRFNVEGTNRGLRTPPDSHYAQWPQELTEQEGTGGWYLRSLSGAEELAVFLLQRGHCLEDVGRIEEAEFAYGLAARLAPASPAREFQNQVASRLHRASQDVPFGAVANMPADPASGAGRRLPHQQDEYLKALLLRQQLRMRSNPQVEAPASNRRREPRAGRPRYHQVNHGVAPKARRRGNDESDSSRSKRSGIVDHAVAGRQCRRLRTLRSGAGTMAGARSTRS